jgi:hypothetical protein
MGISEKAPSTLLELIHYFSNSRTENSDSIPPNYHIYEMGRGIKSIDTALFTEFEAANTPWPYPFIKSAWFALFFTPSKQDMGTEKPDYFHIWFLKFPLDEQGLLVQNARDTYIKQFLDQVGSSSKEDITLKVSTIDSPYGFKPSEEKMANINAIIKHRLNQLPSQYYQAVLHYLYKEKGKENNWQSLGYQGLADLSCYMHNHYQNKKIEEKLSESIEQLPIEMLKALSTCLEHHQLSKQLDASIQSRAIKTQHLDIPQQLENMIACLRCISASKNSSLINVLLKQALESTYRENIELLAVVCGRCWNNLKEPWIMLLFLEALAVNSSGLEAFNIMVRDLLFIPGMRDTLLEQFRNPQRSPELTIAIGDFYSSR